MLNQRDTIQNQLIDLAWKSSWDKRNELFQAEDVLAKRYWVSAFENTQMLNDKKVQRYLALTSLPFLVRELLDEHDHLSDDEQFNEIFLRKIWSVSEVDTTAILPTGSIDPSYVFIFGTIKEPFQQANRSGTHDIFLRKALFSANLLHVSWFTHTIKFPGITLTDNMMRQQFDQLKQEIYLLKPRIIIALGKEVHEAIKKIKFKDDVLITLLTEPAYYIKHKMSYHDYSEAIKNVIEVVKEK